MNSPTSTATNSEIGKPSGSRQKLFPQTQWSVISLARGADNSRAMDGLRQLAVNYWRPLYLYLRKRGENHEDASDSVQGFFEFVFSSGFFEHIEREGGKFRSYLLKSLERWRSRRRIREGAQKRGGRATHVSLEGAELLEEVAELGDEFSPEAAFDRQWAADLVARAVSGIRADYAKRDRGEWFEVLRPALPGGGVLRPYADLAAEMGCSEGSIKKGVFDLRNAFAARLRSEIRATVRTNEDAEEELRYLVSVMSGTA